MYDAPFTGPKETRGQDPSNKGWNLPPALQQKWIRNKDTGCLSKVKDLSVELKGLQNNTSKAEQALKTSSKSPPNGISSKMKIIKNKNKNGRIVIVMSKYMDNGVHSTKIKNRATSAVENQEEPTRNNLNTDNPFDGETSDQGGSLSKVSSADAIRERLTNKDELSKATPGQTGQQAINPMEICHGQPPHPNSSPMPAEKAPSHTDAEVGARKRNLSEPGDDVRDHKQFFTYRSISAPNTVLSSPQREPINLHYRGSQTSQAYGYDFTDTILEEPIDLSCGPTRTSKQIPTVHCAVEKPAECSEKEDDVKPFVGNVIITDITTNCLTVTFKEYVPGE